VPKSDKHIIYPVILKVPPESRDLTGRDQTVYLRGYARQAVAASARQSGIDLPALEKGASGAPVVKNGVYWSLAHKPEYVAGVAARAPVGIDIEKIRPVRAALFYRITDEQERRLAQFSDEMFYRFWTAKEAVLKVTGLGLAGLSRCKITDICSAVELVVVCDGIKWRVAQWLYDNHLISIIANDNKIDWNLPS
jgi:4'-phosphopantetheinyl transferase